MPDRETASETEDAATTWAAKAERGLTADDRQALDQWLEGDSRLGAFVRAQAAWIHAERAVALGKMPEPEDGVGPVQVTADDGLRAVAIGIAAEISAREKRVVEMSELGF